MVKHGVLFSIGGVIYYCLEFLYRGFSSGYMILVGGLCFVLIGLVNEIFPWTMPLWLQSIIATVVVTIVEFISGMVLNIWLGLGIWDYSNLPYNLYGQICLYFSLIWFALSPMAIFFDDWLRYKLFGEDKPKYRLV